MSDNHGWALFPNFFMTIRAGEATIVMSLPHPGRRPQPLHLARRELHVAARRVQGRLRRRAGGGRRTRQLWAFRKRCNRITSRCRASRSACATPHSSTWPWSGGSSSPTSTRWSTYVPAGRRGAIREPRVAYHRRRVDGTPDGHGPCWSTRRPPPRLVDAAKRPGFTVESWAPLAGVGRGRRVRADRQLQRGDELVRIRRLPDELGHQPGVGGFVQAGQRNRRGGVPRTRGTQPIGDFESVVNSMSVYEFTGRIRSAHRRLPPDGAAEHRHADQLPGS